MHMLTCLLQNSGFLMISSISATHTLRTHLIREFLSCTTYGSEDLDPRMASQEQCFAKSAEKLKAPPVIIGICNPGEKETLCAELHKNTGSNQRTVYATINAQQWLCIQDFHFVLPKMKCYRKCLVWHRLWFVDVLDKCLILH